MEVHFFDLRQQYHSMKSEVRSALEEVLAGGRFTLGEKVDYFELNFAAYIGTKYAIAVNSGTSALWLALLAAGVREGDEVITTPNTFIATAEAISFAGAIPLFIDIDEETYNLDPYRLREFLDKNCEFHGNRLIHLSTNRPVTGVIPVHLYGHPCDMEPILQLAASYNLKVIEDCAQAHGAEYQFPNSSISQFQGWVRVGRIGDAGCFSFYPTKNLGAYGEGGAVVTDSTEVAERVRMLRDHGQMVKNRHQLKGFNCRMSAFQGAILGIKLKYLEEWNSQRRQRADMYNRLLSHTPLITPKQASYAKHVHHLYVVRSEKKDDLQNYLRSRGIQTAVHYPTPVHLQEAYRELGYAEGSFPGAEKHCRQVLSLPIYPELKEEEIVHVAQEIKAFFR